MAWPTMPAASPVWSGRTHERRRRPRFWAATGSQLTTAAVDASSVSWERGVGCHDGGSCTIATIGAPGRCGRRKVIATQPGTCCSARARTAARFA